MKKTKEKIFEYLSKEINAHFSDELEFAFIFGSWARFENRSDSDIDLMVVFKNQKTHSGKVDGFKEKFIDFKKESLITLVLVALLARDSDIFTLDDVINQLLDGDKKYLGFCNTPYTHEYLIANLPIILDSLLDEKFIESLNTDGEFTINRNNALEKLKRLSDGNDVQLQKKFLGSATTQNDKQILRQCLEIGMDFALDDKQKVLNYYPEDQIRNRFIDQIPSVGIGMAEIINKSK